jgi:hypothetical protein
MSYSGSFTWLHDIGALAASLILYSGDTLDAAPNKYAWTEFHSAAEDVRTQLTKTVLYSWSNGSAGLKPFTGYEGSNQINGLTTVGRPSGKSGQANYPGWYDTDLSYGKGSTWHLLLDFWYTNIWN